MNNMDKVKNHLPKNPDTLMLVIKYTLLVIKYALIFFYFHISN